MESLHSLSVGEMAARLGLAMALGAVVGLDRERKNHPAGLRTMVLVSLGSAAFVISGWEMMVALSPDSEQGRAGLSRVLQGIVGGIGFLGAGSILQSSGRIRGMTTAAAIWVTAALGVAAGLGQYLLASLAGCGALFTLLVLQIAERRAAEWGHAHVRGGERRPPERDDAPDEPIETHANGTAQERYEERRKRQGRRGARG